MIKWLFFDLGSTLIDESECEEYRLLELLRQPNAPSREVLMESMREFASQNRPHYKETVKKFGLQAAAWPSHLEKLYPGVPQLLAKLHKRYRLGIIANQNPGTEERLRQFGIREYFDFVASSAELGVSKPDPAIFLYALNQAHCAPDEACMIGDRPDNDIEPAGLLGMYTIWVRQGAFANGNPALLPSPPNVTADNFTRIPEILEKMLDCKAPL